MVYRIGERVFYPKMNVIASVTQADHRLGVFLIEWDNTYYWVFEAEINPLRFKLYSQSL